MTSKARRIAAGGVLAAGLSIVAAPAAFADGWDYTPPPPPDIQLFDAFSQNILDNLSNTNYNDVGLADVISVNLTNNLADANGFDYAAFADLVPHLVGPW